MKNPLIYFICVFHPSLLLPHAIPAPPTAASNHRLIFSSHADNAATSTADTTASSSDLRSHAYVSHHRPIAAPAYKKLENTEGLGDFLKKDEEMDFLKEDKEMSSD
nr:hypothetical protein Iba_scaffold12691CG0020 [Ipomoea batatas]